MSKVKNVAELTWLPWVGKHYDETGIMILGKCAYYRKGDTWQETFEKDKEASRRELVWANRKKPKAYKPYRATESMFLKSAGQGYNENNMKFWEAVAFNNHSQKVVQGVRGGYANRKTANRAFEKTIEIIKPKLVLVWGVDVLEYMNLDYQIYRANKINNAFPIISKASEYQPCSVGMKHPSRFFSGNKWMEFLLNNDNTKDAVNSFVEYLQS